MKKVIVKKSAAEKIRSFNPWIYKNEIKKVQQDVEKGELVEIYSPDGQFLGVGYINPLSKIMVRILSFFEKPEINTEFFKLRIKKALEKRSHLRSYTNAFRVVHSEADFLPGLIVDLYDRYLSIQINTAGMEKFRSEILEAIISVLKPEGIIDKSDEKSRQKEGLDTVHQVIYGNIPEKVLIEEQGVRFYVYLKKGQKTGFFLDQRKNRKLVSEYVQNGFKVLDLFSNAGGFGIYAGLKGADFIKFVDISENAVQQILENCELNKITSFQVVDENVFDFLKKEIKREGKYDLIIIDPPSFAKTKHEKEGGLRGFKYLILNSIKLLKERGMIAVFSCSHHIGMDDLKAVTMDAAKDTKTRVEIIEHLFQDKDHPYILNIPFSFYLKGFIFRKV
ncbi:class I SAM-dependent rRNA methyltransferase [Persephonella sp.]